MKLVFINFRVEDLADAATQPAGGAVYAENNGHVTSAGVSPSKLASDVMPGSPSHRVRVDRKRSAAVHPISVDTAQFVHCIL